MVLKEVNGLNIIINKQYELLLAIASVYLSEHEEYREDELEYIETPNIDYFNKLKELINSVDHKEIIEMILKYKDEASLIFTSLSLDDNYDIDLNKVDLDNLPRFITKDEIKRMSILLKDYAKNIKWDEYFNSNMNNYKDLMAQFCDLPSNLDLGDVNKFYNIDGYTFNYIPSVLMNGGFSHTSRDNNLYYNKGFIYNEENKLFKKNIPYFIECLFHEYSHSFVNPLVDKYFDRFTNIDKLLEDAKKNNLPKTYSNAKVLLYEYYVRANAYIMTLKYFPEKELSSWIQEHGFNYLNDLIEYTINNKDNYESYEDFFDKELIDYVNRGFSNIKNEVK